MVQQFRLFFNVYWNDNKFYMNITLKITIITRNIKIIYLELNHLAKSAIFITI